MRPFSLVAFLLICASIVHAACSPAVQNADYSELASSTTVTLTTGTSGGITHKAAINAVGDLIIFSAWCYQTCTPGTLTMGSQTAIRTSVSGDHTSDGGSLFTGQGFIYYILSSTQSGNQTITWSTSGGASQTQVSYIDFNPGTGCTASHHIDSSLGSASNGVSTATTPTISGVSGDLLFNFVYTSQHVISPVNSPWSCPIYSLAGESQSCAFNSTVNGVAYILSGAASDSTNWTLINTSTAYESLISSFTLSSSAANVCPSGTPTGVTTCFFIAANGADTNTGADESHPWVHFPGSQNCASNCASHPPGAGNGYILRGGDTWHAGNSGLTPYTGIVAGCSFNSTASAVLCLSGKAGANGSPIYYGVDPAWFSGASWSRPILNADNPLTPNPGVFADSVASCAFQSGAQNDLISTESASWIIIDNWEMTGLCSKLTGAQNGVDRYVLESADSNDIFEHLYIHGWTHIAFGGSYQFSLRAFDGSNVSANHDRHIQVVVDGSDSDPAGLAVMFTGGYSVIQSVFRYTTQVVISPMHIWADNLMEHWYCPGDNLAHPNLLESTGDQSGVNAIYNNVFRNIITDSGSCPVGSTVGIWPFPPVGTTDYVFNNVFYNTPATGIEYYNISQNGSDQGQQNIFNNTFEDSQTTLYGCTNVHLHPWAVESNHYIFDSGSPYCGTGPNTSVDEKIMTHATATSAGYTASQTYAYAPTSSGSPTVGAGANQTSGFCAALSSAAVSDPTLLGAAAACTSDTRYACSYSSSTHSVTCPARTSVARPSSTSWDAGAYQFSSTGQVSAPTFAPGAGTYVGPVNVTLSTTTGGATICYTTDGSTPTTNGGGTCTHGTTYLSPVNIAVQTTLQAIASLSGSTDSAVVSATYGVQPPAPSSMMVMVVP